MVIYKIENKINGKIYIGQTIQKLSRRISSHICPSYKNITPIDMAIRKYGIESFDVSTIDHASSMDELNEKERFWIKYYNSLSPNGYNLEEGGRNGRKSQSTRKKVSAANKGRFLGEKSPKSKKVYKFTIDGDLVAEYGSAREAGRENKMSPSQIASSCRGEHYIGKGFVWSYSKTPNLDIPRKSAYLICFQGKTMNLKEWSEKTGIPYGTLQSRLNNGWEIEKALTLPIDERKRNNIVSKKRK